MRRFFVRFSIKEKEREMIEFIEVEKEREMIEVIEAEKLWTSRLFCKYEIPYEA